MSKKNNSPKKKQTPLTQVKKGVEQLSDAQLKEQTRWYVPSAIIRLVEICNSKNDAVALGAIKVLLAKNMPDLKATELKGELELIGPIIYKPSTFNENMEALPKTRDSA